MSQYCKALTPKVCHLTVNPLQLRERAQASGPLLFCVSESSFLNLCHPCDPDWLLGIESGLVRAVLARLAPFRQCGSAGRITEAQSTLENKP